MTNKFDDDDVDVDIDIDMVETKKSKYENELPLDICPLPSKGRLYPADHPLHMKEFMEFKAMTTYEENILATPALLRQGTVLNVLIDSCLLDKTINSETFLMGDKAALLIFIRISGFGDEYKSIITCGSCKKEFPHIFSLSKAKIKPLGADPDVEGKNLFSFTLPKSGKVVKFSLMTDKDDLEVMEIQKARKSAYSSVIIDTTITDRLLIQIKEIGGEKDKGKIRRIIESMPIMDSRALRKYMAKIEPDLLMKEEVTCRHCGMTSERHISMGYDFFWPDIDE